AVLLGALRLDEARANQDAGDEHRAARRRDAYARPARRLDRDPCAEEAAGRAADRLLVAYALSDRSQPQSTDAALVRLLAEGHRQRHPRRAAGRNLRRRN